MADKQPADNKPTKRIVKNPETFRERAIKAAEGSDKPKRHTQLKTAGSKLVKPVLKPIGKTAKQIANLPPLRILRRPLRIIGKILLPVYIRKSWRELRLVTWPNWQQSRQLTMAVIIFAGIFGAIIAVVDYGLDKLFRDILLK